MAPPPSIMHCVLMSDIITQVITITLITHHGAHIHTMMCMCVMARSLLVMGVIHVARKLF
jgi:hypothetical protein